MRVSRFLRSLPQAQPPSAAAAVGAASTLVRPQVLEDFQKGRVAGEVRKWQLFKVATWVLTLTAGVTVALGGEEERGENRKDTILSPLRRWVRGTYEDLLRGEPKIPPQLK